VARDWRESRETTNKLVKNWKALGLGLGVFFSAPVVVAR
jgi:hypothetical protein